MSGEDCNVACKRVSMECDVFQFPFINTVETLQGTFKCQRFAMENGPDIPCFVSDSSHPKFGTCIVTEDLPKCNGISKSTTRVCACSE